MIVGGATKATFTGRRATVGADHFGNETLTDPKAYHTGLGLKHRISPSKRRGGRGTRDAPPGPGRREQLRQIHHGIEASPDQPGPDPRFDAGPSPKRNATQRKNQDPRPAETLGRARRQPYPAPVQPPANARTDPAPQWRPWMLPCAFFALVLVLQQLDALLHDEGALAHGCSEAMLWDPGAMLFFLKCRPFASLLYALPAGLGRGIFAAAQGALVALSVHWVSETARALKVRRPYLVALVYASSPALVLGTASAVINVTAPALIAFFLYLLHRCQKPLAAAFVLLVLPGFRFELLLVVLVYAPVLWRRLGPKFLWAFSPGVAFTIAGAFWHGDPGWFLRFPPAVQALPEALQHNETIDASPMALLTLFPLVAALPAAFRGELRAERVAGALIVAVLFGLPFTGLLHLDNAPRYLLPALPFLALWFGTIEKRVALRPRWSLSTWLPVALWASLLLGPRMDPAGTAAVLAAVVLLLLCTTGRPALPAALTIAAALVAPIAFAQTTLLVSPELSTTIKAMADRRLQSVEGPIGTNDITLVMAAEPRGWDICFQLQRDQRFELDALTSEHRNQRDRVRRALGRALHVCEGPVKHLLLSRDSRRQIPPGASLVRRVGAHEYWVLGP